MEYSGKTASQKANKKAKGPAKEEKKQTKRKASEEAPSEKPNPLKTPKFAATAPDKDVALAKLKSHRERQKHRKTPSVGLYSGAEVKADQKKALAEREGLTTVHSSPFWTGRANLSGQRFSFKKEKDPTKRDPQTTTSAKDFPRTKSVKADYAQFLPKLKQSDFKTMAKQYDDYRAHPAPFTLPSAPTQADRHQTMFHGVTQDSESHRGEQVGGKAFRAVARAVSEDKPQLRKLLKKERAPVPKDPNKPLAMKHVFPFMSPAVNKGGGSHYPNVLSGTEQLGDTEAYILRNYFSDDSDAEKPDPFSMEERKKVAKEPEPKK
jgi:hypothetical protein